ncbi:MAG: CPBP family intramembrane metalloprotease [Acidobacteria bacterium]|nr:CPBP family intramembrane metalloprotease [Acidobacteriota bacterium]
MSDWDAPALPPPKPGVYWAYSDVLLMGSLAVPLLVAAAGLVTLPTLFWGWKPPAKAVPLLASQFVFYVLWLGFLVAWLKGRYRRPFWRSMAWERPEKGWGNCFAWGVVTALGVIALGGVLRPPQMEMPLMELLRDRTSLFLVGGFAITLGPLWEELAFRGFLMPLLVRNLTAVPAILSTAVLFSALHGPEYAWSWKHLVLITVAGVAFGWMRQHSGSTAAATVMHAGYNVVFFFGMLVPRPS